MNPELISEGGFQKFVSEFKNLAEIEKPHWVKEKKVAAEHGDRSENAEYISAKEMLRNIDKRLRFLEKIINNSQVVQTQKLSHERINFGSQVQVLDLDTNIEKTFIILGTFETNPSINIISNKSPLGKALLGKETGDEFEFKINETIMIYEIIGVKLYQGN